MKNKKTIEQMNNYVLLLDKHIDKTITLSIEQYFEILAFFTYLYKNENSNDFRLYSKYLLNILNDTPFKKYQRSIKIKKMSQL